MLVTGGLGFIGSHLAERLADLGARVTIVDSLVPSLGGNEYNVTSFRERVHVSMTDLRDQDQMRCLLRDQECVFNLAGQVSHVDSMANPEADLDINCRAQLSFLEALRGADADTRVIFASTRQIYGRPQYLPVDEAHPLQPTDLNGVNKLAAEQYHFIYAKMLGLPTIAIRLTNTYGPRQLMHHGRQGFIPVFIRRAMEDGTIMLYGGGTQVRDANYVTDVVDAFVRAGARADALSGQVFNTGAEPAFSLWDFATLLISIVGSGSFVESPWPQQEEAIDIGGFEADFSRISATLGWQPVVDLEEGLRRTVDFYRRHGANYW